MQHDPGGHVAWEVYHVWLGIKRKYTPQQKPDENNKQKMHVLVEAERILVRSHEAATKSYV